MLQILQVFAIFKLVWVQSSFYFGGSKLRFLFRFFFFLNLSFFFIYLTLTDKTQRRFGAKKNTIWKDSLLLFCNFFNNNNLISRYKKEALPSFKKISPPNAALEPHQPCFLGMELLISQLSSRLLLCISVWEVVVQKCKCPQKNANAF